MGDLLRLSGILCAIAAGACRALPFLGGYDPSRCAPGLVASGIACLVLDQESF